METNASLRQGLMAAGWAEMLSWAMGRVGGTLGRGRVRACWCPWGLVPEKKPPLCWYRLGPAARSSSEGMALGVLVGSVGDVGRQRVLAAMTANGSLGCMNKGRARG